MAPTWRGPNPDPEVRAALKADKASKVKATPKESTNDAAYFPLFRKQPQSSSKSKQTKPKGKVKIPTIEEGSQEDEDNKARYFWPSHHFPSLSQSHPHRLGPDIHPAMSSCPSRPPHAILTDLEDEEVFARVGLVLKAVCFDLRLIILDLTTCYLEFEPLLHSSPQIFTKEQWIGVSEVPHSVRGFKIGIALEMRHQVLAWLSFDNLWNVGGGLDLVSVFLLINLKNSFDGAQLRIIYSFNNCAFQILFFNTGSGARSPLTGWKLSERSRELKQKKSSSTTIYAFFTNTQNTPLNGGGSYSLDDIFRLAGLPPLLLARVVFASPEMWARLGESYVRFASERWFKTNQYLKASRNRNAPGEFAISASLKEQLVYPTKLRVHGKARATVSKCLAEAVRKYNVRKYNLASKRTHEEASKPIFSRNNSLMSVDEHPFDLAELTPGLLLYGHLGNLIVGEHWDELLTQSKADLKRDRILVEELNVLPAHLTRLQRLSLTPLTHLTEPEIALLRDSFGINPITAYFNKLYASKNTPKVKINRAELSLFRDPIENYCPTRLYAVPQTNKTVWTLLDIPHRTEDLQDVACFSQAELHIRTFKHVKENTKGWTVGPLDFCGHGRVFNNGPSTFRCLLRIICASEERRAALVATGGVKAGRKIMHSRIQARLTCLKSALKLEDPKLTRARARTELKAREEAGVKAEMAEMAIHVLEETGYTMDDLEMEMEMDETGAVDCDMDTT
ncbi:hypothetical protein DFH09DRAFT_1090082 [Mycena vulgaris]|nr:hypothetical protein DFH09DRAFT_1090082 [Mycena vulgaris]